jgi:hypothetical protein
MMPLPPVNYLLGPNIPLNAMFSNALNVCPFFIVKDLYKTVGKTITLYVLILKFSEKRERITLELTV